MRSTASFYETFHTAASESIDVASE